MNYTAVNHLYLLKLPFADAIPVNDDAGWLELCGLVEGDEKFTDH